MSAMRSGATAMRAAASARPGPGAGAGRRAGAPAEPWLRVVATPAQARTRVPFVLLCMAVLAAALLGALLLNTSMAQGEYERQELQARLVEATQGEEQVLADLAHAESSDQLASAARALGMVPTTTGGYLRLADGVVLGSPAPAVAP